jgi:hypothetical protein
VFRNVQSANQLRFTANASIFVETLEEMFKLFFTNVATNKRVKSGTNRTDIDVIVLTEKTLYVIECKHSVPPTCPHEMRDIWEEIEKGASQLEIALEALSDSGRRHEYLSSWFPKVNRNETANLQIKPCLLCSHRIFAGMEYRGIPIRDSASISRLFDDGVISLGAMDEKGETVMYRHQIINEGGFSPNDLDDYLSIDARYFKSFAPFMRPVSRFDNFGDVVVARETYCYEVTLDEWRTHLDSLGCTRQADVRRTVIFPWSSEELLSQAEKLT